MSRKSEWIKVFDRMHKKDSETSCVNPSEQPASWQVVGYTHASTKVIFPFDLSLGS